MEFGLNVPLTEFQLPLIQTVSDFNAQQGKYVEGITRAGATWAAACGYENVLEHLCTRGVFPYTQGINAAAWNGKLGTLRILAKWKQLPAQIGVDAAAAYRHYGVVRYMIDQEGVFPTTFGANWAACRGSLCMLKLLASRGVVPDTLGIDVAAANGHVTSVAYLQQYHNLNATQRGANWAAANGHVRMLRIIGAAPNEHGANGAAAKGFVHVLRFIRERYNVRATVVGAVAAAEAGYAHVLEELWNRDGVMVPLNVTSIYPEVQQLLAEQRRSKVFFQTTPAGSECAVCLDSKDDTWVSVGCDHSFHKECLMVWLKTGDSCPMCRKKVVISE